MAIDNLLLEMRLQEVLALVTPKCTPEKYNFDGVEYYVVEVNRKPRAGKAWVNGSSIPDMIGDTKARAGHVFVIDNKYSKKRYSHVRILRKHLDGN